MPQIGQVYRFAYVANETSADDFVAHAGARVTVMRALSMREAAKYGTTAPMWLVRAFDGWVVHAFEDELVAENVAPAPVSAAQHVTMILDCVDTDNCRVYYRGKSGTRYCIQDETSFDRPSFVFYVCSSDGEPSHKPNMNPRALPWPDLGAEYAKQVATQRDIDLARTMGA